MHVMKAAIPTTVGAPAKLAADCSTVTQRRWRASAPRPVEQRPATGAPHRLSTINAPSPSTSLNREKTQSISQVLRVMVRCHRGWNAAGRMLTGLCICHRSRSFRHRLGRFGMHHLLTRIHVPHRDGEADRLVQASVLGCLCVRHGAADSSSALAEWLRHSIGWQSCQHRMHGAVSHSDHRRAGRRQRCAVCHPPRCLSRARREATTGIERMQARGRTGSASAGT